MGKDESKLSFLRTSQHFYRALAIFEPQIYVVSEQFQAENISLLSGVLFGTMRLFLDSTKGSPLRLLRYFATQWVSKIPKGPSFTFSAL